MYEFHVKFKQTPQNLLAIGDFWLPVRILGSSIPTKPVWMGPKRPFPGAPQCMKLSKNQGFTLPTYIRDFWGPDWAPNSNPHTLGEKG
jgi:hypothetical protein